MPEWWIFVLTYCVVGLFVFASSKFGYQVCNRPTCWTDAMLITPIAVAMWPLIFAMSCMGI